MMTFTTNDPQATSTRRRNVRTLLALPAAAALSISLSGWALPVSAQAATPATITQAAPTQQGTPAQRGTLQLMAEHPANPGEPMVVEVTGGTPGKSLQVDAKNSGAAGNNSISTGALFDQAGNARVPLTAPPEGWLSGSYLFYAVTDGDAASGFLELSDQMGNPANSEVIVSPTSYPAGPFGTAGVRVSGLEPGEAVKLNSSVPGSVSTIVSRDVTLVADDQGVAVGEVPAIEGGYQPGQLYDLSAANGKKGGIGRFLMPS